MIGLLSPIDLGSFSISEAMSIANALSNSNRKVDSMMAKSLGVNIPANKSITNFLTIASAVPLECFSNSPAPDLIKGLAKMDLNNMDTFKKSYTTSQVFYDFKDKLFLC